MNRGNDIVFMVFYFCMKGGKIVRARRKQTNTSGQHLLTYSEAAARYAVSQNTVKKLAAAANAIVRFGRTARIIAPKLDDFLDEIAG